ncbi:MAG: dicarboxylate/amino acid:cation symporter [Gemmatimonadetes bacterium]|nr:dicarboxylate/amino acid:cation symporter [Gemmatimonadota bacterium]
MSLTTRVLIGLLAGLGAGIAVSASGEPALARAAVALEPVGTLWVNAIRMTVIPLVVSSLVGAVASASDPGAIGRIGGRGLLLFLALLAAAAALSVTAIPPLLGGLTIDPAAAATLRASAASLAEPAAESARRLPGFAQWVVDLVPTNPVRAAADGALLPLILFSLALGLAASRLGEPLRQDLARFFRALAEAMLLLVRWILALAPVGVFALALPLAARMGAAAAGAVVYYIALVSTMCALAIATLYPVAAYFGRVPLRSFARASAPAQAVAISSRSSLASLPAMIEGMESRLGLPPELVRFFLPLAASTLRLGAVIGQTAGALFIARLYGVSLEPAQLATIAVTSMVTSFTVPGIPGGSIIVMVPVLLAAGLPVEGIGILLGVDTIPDMFRTTTNVTADLATLTVLGRGAGPGGRAGIAAAAAPARSSGTGGAGTP